MKYLLTLAIVTLFIGVGCSVPQQTSQNPLADQVLSVNLLDVDDDGASTVNSDALNTLVVTQKGTLSEEEIAGLQFMREEEKLARDVYMALYDQFGIRAFDNITNSEQSHTDAVLRLLDVYAIADPGENKQPGVFMNPELQALYNQLIADGSESVVAALRVGALIEEVDIIDLQKEAAKTIHEDILAVYQNLERGSRNHLRAFVRQLEQQGETYEPALLSEQAYNAIISSDTERGVGQGGHGRGE